MTGSQVILQGPRRRRGVNEPLRRRLGLWRSLPAGYPMPIGRTLLALLLVASVSLGADTLRTLDGREIVGDVVSITDKEIVIRSQGKEQTVPTLQVLQLDVGPAGKLAAGTKYTDVELTDGSVLHCSQLTLRGKEAQMTLLGGQAVKVPLEVVASFLNEAQDENLQKQWKEFVAKKRASDLLVVQRDGELTSFKGTFGEADDEGKQIQFDLDSKGTFRGVDLVKVQGIIFVRPVDPNLPSTICTAYDSSNNAVAASAVAVTPAGYTVTSPSGAKIEYPKKLLSRFDYNTGKLRYLSDMTPVKEVVTSTQGDPEAPRKDKNLDGGPLRLGKTVYFKGLAVHAYTLLEYQLDGEYREFKCWLGVDELVGGSEGQTIVKFEGDGKVLFETAVTRKDPPREVKFNIKDVQKMRIVVSSAELLDLGKHVNLADAKISK